MPEENDAQYTTATKAVDDRMRTDILGPNVLKVLQDYKPANDYIQDIVAETIEKHPIARKHLKTFISNHNINRKGIWMERIISTVVGIVITIIIGYIALHVLGYHADS